MRLPPHFSHYIAGLWEGDGHADRRHHTYIALTFHHKNFPLVHLLHHTLGGTIRDKHTHHAYVLTLRKKDAIARFFHHIHNKLRTPKHHDLQGFATTPGYKDTTDLLTNGWLAGFLDADGGFKIRWTKEKKHPDTGKIHTKHRIALSLVLEQRQVHPLTEEPFEPVMTSISKAFDVKLTQSQHHGKWYWKIEISGLTKVKKVMTYLDRFPLLSAKRCDFEDWKQAYRLLCAGAHLTDEGKEKLWRLKQGMNRQRQVFCWTHLTMVS
jgi:hypothetical protein